MIYWNSRNGFDLVKGQFEAVCAVFRYPFPLSISIKAHLCPCSLDRHPDAALIVRRLRIPGGIDLQRRGTVRVVLLPLIREPFLPYRRIQRL